MNSITGGVYTPSTGNIKNPGPKTFSIPSNHAHLVEDHRFASVRDLMPDYIRRDLKPSTRDQATRYMERLSWVKHPDGFRVYVPEGAESFFELIKNAILRDPWWFLCTRPSAEEICERLSLQELKVLLRWLDQYVIATMPQANRDPLAPLTLNKWLNDLWKHIRPIVEERREHLRNHGADSFLGMNEGLCL